jgi:hypothetical protein
MPLATERDRASIVRRSSPPWPKLPEAIRKAMLTLAESAQ